MCGIVGYSGTVPAELATALLTESGMRGLHATGISYPAAGGLVTEKEPVGAREFVTRPAWTHFIARQATQAIFHTRYNTSGDSRNNANNQPLACEDVALAMNGIISMATQAEFEAAYGVKTKTANDSEILLNLLTRERAKHPDMHTALSYALVDIFEVQAPIFAVGILTAQGELYAVCDDIRPLWLWEITGKAMGFASTRYIAEQAAQQTGERLRLKRAVPFTLYNLTGGWEQELLYER